MKRLSLGVAVALLAAVGCSDSGVIGNVKPSDLAGSWVSTSMVFTSNEDPSVTADVSADATISLTFTETTYAGTVVFPGELEIFAGSYEISGDTLTLNEEGQGSPDVMTFTLTSDQLTLVADDDEFDFDDDGTEDPATMTTVLAREEG